MDAPTFVGCLVRVRLVGVIFAKQTEDRKTERNDRQVGVAVQSRRHKTVRQLRDLPGQLLSEIEHFFVSYNTIKGKTFKPLGRYGSARALALVRKGMKDAARHKPS
jgi:inorganic pyrophosphatase